MIVKFEVTLRDLRKAGACFPGYNKLVRGLQGKGFSSDDEDRESYINFRHEDPVSLTEILRTNGLDDALWALRCVNGVDRDARMFAVWCARQVQHLMRDQRSIEALNVAERFANGEATEGELAAAESAAWDAAESAAWDAAESAARAAAESAARDAARAAAESAARDAAWAAAWDADWDAAWDADWDAAWVAAWDAARDAQEKMFVAMCEGRAPWQKGNGKWKKPPDHSSTCFSASLWFCKKTFF